MNDKLTELMAEILKIPQSAIIDDLEMMDIPAWDSLKHMELIVCLEQRFGMELTFDEIIAMRCVREIRRILFQRGVNI
ncbi:MAG: acyl carrier protein [Deltaproteobacteria bacterium]|nr:acyl carrier protein [Deltaproteobacteria bacterium]